MSTMYYAVIDPCSQCGHGERHAICKNYRTFRAYLDSEPWGLPVTSWANWKTVLARPNVDVVSEYGETILTCDFFAKVEEIGPQERHVRKFSNGQPVSRWIRGCGGEPTPVYESWQAMMESNDRWEAFVDDDGFLFYARDFT